MFFKDKIQNTQIRIAKESSKNEWMRSHHEARSHLDFVGWRDEQPHREKHDSKDLLERTLCPVPLLQTQRTVGDHSPLTRTFGRFLSKTTGTFSASDLMTLLPPFKHTCVSSFPRSVMHIACLISRRLAKKKEHMMSQS